MVIIIIIIVIIIIVISIIVWLFRQTFDCILVETGWSP